MRLYKKSYHKSQFWLQQIISSNDQLIFFPMFFICPLFLYNLNNNLVPPIHDVWLKVNKNNLTKKNVTVVQIDWGVKGNKLDAVTKLAFGWRLRMVSRAQIEPCTFFRMSSLLCSRSSLFFPEDASITITSDLLFPYPKPFTYLTRPCFQISRSVVVSENNSGFFSHHSNPTGLVWSSIDWKMGITL